MKGLKRAKWRRRLKRLGRAAAVAVLALIGGLIAVYVIGPLIGLHASADYNTGWLAGITLGAGYGYYRGGVDEPAHEVLHLNVDDGNIDGIVEIVATDAVRLGVRVLEVHVHR